MGSFTGKAMKNWNISAKGYRNLWKANGHPGITWFACVLETDRKGFLCFLCLFGFILFDIEARKVQQIN